MSAGIPTPPVLTILVDALLPAESPADGGPRYPSASELGVDRDVAELVATLPSAERAEFATLLRAVDGRVANLLLGGRPVRFSRLSSDARAAYLRGWSESRLAIKRRGFHALKRLAAGLYYAPRAGVTSHPLWPRIGYEPPAPAEGSDPFGGLGPIVPEEDVEERVDVAVVGSGAGGSVVAARLTAAGHRVALLEAGAWVPRLEYPRYERAAHEQLFVGRGVVTNSTHSIGLLAGEAVGGGTAINWMTCLPPRPEARAEWARAGMTGIDGPEFDRAYAAVAARLEVSTAESEVNASNDALRRGCRALGYREGVDWDLIPRNAVGCRARCGFCTFGCPYGARRSTLTTFLSEALGRGLRLYASTRVERVEIEHGRAAGVVGTSSAGPRPRRIHLRAREVVLAAGALQTPALLLRSGVKGPGIGHGLRLDPTTALVAEFPDPVRTWSGPHQTIGVYRFQTADEAAHGPWIEVAPAHPGLAAIALPWDGAVDFRRRMERLEHVATPIVLVRDVGEGTVGIDREGRPQIRYELHARDRRNLLRGIVETARILRAAGATRIGSLHTPRIEAGTGDGVVRAQELDRFVEEVLSRGIRENSIALFSAHPMGSARAGLDPRSSTCRPTGEVHGVEGLWVADGGLLPSAPGANPMMSILAVAWRVADGLQARLAASTNT